MARKLVFRISPREASHDNAEVHIITGVLSALGHVNHLLNRFGPNGALKLLANILIRRTAYYYLKRDKRIASDGLIALGHCRVYPVSKRDAVIGSIHTAPRFRGAGLATAALRALIHAPFCSRFEYLYIDVFETNLASRRAIEKAGFGSVHRTIDAA